jgi:CheY-like chemotaxis protein
MSPVPAASLTGKRILLVEDQVLVALDLKMTLEDAGAVVVGPFGRLDRAIAAVEAEAPLDGAILDVDIASRPVFPVADRLRARGVPFVFHTGRSDLGRLRARYGETVVLLKPSRPEAVARQLGGALATAQEPEGAAARRVSGR